MGGLSSVSVAPEQRGLVAHADLLQFDARSEGAGQVAHELPEVDSFLCSEVDNQLVAVELPLGLGDLHLELVLGYELAGLGTNLVFIRPLRLQPCGLLVEGQPKDAILGQGGRTTAR